MAVPKHKIDPSFSDLREFLAGSRPEAEAIVLEAPALRQIAEALEGRSPMDVIRTRPGSGGSAFAADGTSDVRV